MLPTIVADHPASGPRSRPSARASSVLDGPERSERPEGRTGRRRASRRRGPRASGLQPRRRTSAGSAVPGPRGRRGSANGPRISPSIEARSERLRALSFSGRSRRARSTSRKLERKPWRALRLPASRAGCCRSRSRSRRAASPETARRQSRGRRSARTEPEVAPVCALPLAANAVESKAPVDVGRVRRSRHVGLEIPRFPPSALRAKAGRGPRARGGSAGSGREGSTGVGQRGRSPRARRQRHPDGSPGSGALRCLLAGRRARPASPGRGRCRLQRGPGLEKRNWDGQRRGRSIVRLPRVTSVELFAAAGGLRP